VNAAAEALPTVKPVIATLCEAWTSEKAGRTSEQFPVAAFVTLLKAKDDAFVMPDAETEPHLFKARKAQLSSLLTMALFGHSDGTVQHYRMVSLMAGEPTLTVPKYCAFLRHQDRYNIDGTLTDAYKAEVEAAEAKAEADAQAEADAETARMMVRLLPRLVIDETFLGTSEESDEQDVYLLKVIHELNRAYELRMAKQSDDYRETVESQVIDAIDRKVKAKA
jgi:hypothetical protein